MWIVARRTAMNALTSSEMRLTSVPKYLHAIIVSEHLPTFVWGRLVYVSLLVYNGCGGEPPFQNSFFANSLLVDSADGFLVNSIFAFRLGKSYGAPTPSRVVRYRGWILGGFLLSYSLRRYSSWASNNGECAMLYFQKSLGNLLNSLKCKAKDMLGGRKYQSKLKLEYPEMDVIAINLLRLQSR